MAQDLSRRAGATLMVALMAVLLLSALAAGIFVMTADAQRGAVSLLVSQRSLALAEAGAAWSVKRGRATSGAFAFAEGTFTVSRSGRPGDFAAALMTGSDRVKLYLASAQWTSTGRSGDARRLVRVGTDNALTQNGTLVPGDNAFGMDAGDLDADGDNDLVLGTAASQIRVFLNDGLGAFTEQGSSPYGANSAVRALRLGDLDADADRDVVVADEGTAPYKLEVWKNNGSGGLTQDNTYSMGGKGTALALGDVKEDAGADVDAVVATDISQFEVWTNNGSAALTQAAVYTTNDGTDPNGIVLSDVDQDGDNDVMLVTQGGNLEKWLNNGSGAFSYSASNALGFAGLSIAAGEFDGAAGEDLLVGELSDDFQTFFNNGSGTFTLNATTDVLGDVYAVALYDLDGDADLDALLGEVDLDRVQVFLNNGSGAFSLDDTIVPGGDVKALVASEFNYAQ